MCLFGQITDRDVGKTVTPQEGGPLCPHRRRRSTRSVPLDRAVLERAACAARFAAVGRTENGSADRRSRGRTSRPGSCRFRHRGALHIDSVFHQSSSGAHEIPRPGQFVTVVWNAPDARAEFSSGGELPGVVALSECDSLPHRGLFDACFRVSPSSRRSPAQKRVAMASVV